MKDKKLQVFVSSTFTDLILERQAAVEAILLSGHIPAGMELFSAGNESQMEVIKKWIDESDVYLLILGGRYGSVDKKTGKSYIQLEYEYATSKKNMPLFSLVISEKGLRDKVKVLGKTAVEVFYGKELKKFTSKVSTKVVKFWDDVKDIKLFIFTALSNFSDRNELVGWIRADKLGNTELLAGEFAKILKENTELRNKLEGLETNANKENRFELKFVVRHNKKDKINEIIKEIKNWEGVQDVSEDEGMTGRRYWTRKISNSANRQSLADSTGNIVDD